MGDYRRLKVWRKAHHATEHFPSTERYGLAIQMRRAAISVASNIVEGVGRNRSTETAQFVRVALASCAELEYQVFLSQELKFLERNEALMLTEQTIELRAMLASLQRRLLSDQPCRHPRRF